MSDPVNTNKIETLKFKSNNEWKELFAYKLNRDLNLADLTNIIDAQTNLQLDKYYINKRDATNGKEPGIINHVLIIQDPSARFVDDRQIKYWNQKTNRPICGIGNFTGGSKETTVAHGLVDATTNQAAAPSSVVVFPRENPGGYLGEYWVRWDEKNIYVGNTGSFTGEFTYTAFY